MKRILLILLLIQVTLAQNVPFITNHPVYYFLERQESLGHIQVEYWSTRPYSYDQINEMLTEVEQHRRDLSESDMGILTRFKQEFNRDFQDEGISFPWSKSNLRRLRHTDTTTVKPFFMNYKQNDTEGWINWSETFRLQNNGKARRGYYTDHVAIFGKKGSIDFTTQYDFYRITKNNQFTEMPDTYKEGYILERDYIQWINWGYPISSLTYTHPDFSIGIHRQPLYWGYSPTNSPILSDNVAPLPYLQWSTEMSHLRFKFIHARLTPNNNPEADTINVRRNLSAQRVEFDLSPNFEFSFNEMVIYAYRDFELGYLNPVNFLFAEEQMQGDLDNKLMAFDFKWRILPGFTTYGTWLFDELDFFKLFSGWWGNKFVFQLGASYFPIANLPVINIEYTAARPWTYSHQYPVNSFTSAGTGLGLKAGPNTQTFKLESFWQINPKIFIQGRFISLMRGDDPGSIATNSYIERERPDDNDSTFFTGNLIHSNYASCSVNYYLTRTLALNFLWKDHNFFELGIMLNW